MPASILLIQSDRSVCAQYCDALEAEGHEILVACDRAEALETLGRQRPDFVVLDAELSHEDGFEVLVEMRALGGHGSVPVLMQCEGDVLRDLRDRALGLGALDLVSSPMELDVLVACVARSLDDVKDEAGTPGGSASRVQAVPERGDLKQTPFPELMHGLHLARLNGVLLVEYGRKKKAIEFRDGWPVCVKSNLVSECLGNYLIRTERCSREAVDESLKRMKTGEGLQGEILVAMDVLDEEGVISVLEDHAREKLFEIFSWRDGSFEVRSRVRIQRGSSIAIEGHPSDLTVQGVRRSTPIKWIDRYIELHAGSFVVPCEAGAEGGLKDIDLTPEEVNWIRSLDGSIKFDALEDAPESIRRLVFGLLSVDLFRVEAAAGNPEAVREVARSAVAAQAANRLDQATEDDLRAELTRLANRMQGANHFEVLGVTQASSDDEIRAAFERVAGQVSSERFHGASSSVRQLASQAVSRIDEAYDRIATREAREEYANSTSSKVRAPIIEEEGRRALRAETEFQNGEALILKRDYESALLCFGRAMENFPKEGEYRAHYGWCLYLCHPDNDVMLAEAVEHCREGVKLAKDREKPYLLLGRLYKAMGKADAAKKMFTRAVQIKPRCVEAMRELRIMNMRRAKDKGVLGRLFRR